MDDNKEINNRPKVKFEIDGQTIERECDFIYAIVGTRKPGENSIENMVVFSHEKTLPQDVIENLLADSAIMASKVMEKEAPDAPGRIIQKILFKIKGIMETAGKKILEAMNQGVQPAQPINSKQVEAKEYNSGMIGISKEQDEEGTLANTKEMAEENSAYGRQEVNVPENCGEEEAEAPFDNQTETTKIDKISDLKPQSEDLSENVGKPSENVEKQPQKSCEPEGEEAKLEAPLKPGIFKSNAIPKIDLSKLKASDKLQ